MKSNEEILLRVLSNHDITFYIPPYQRNYEWEAEQCKVFLDDMIRTYHRNKGGGTTTHFFGTLTFFTVMTSLTEPSKLILIDGQQRITTTMLMLAAARDLSDDKRFIDTINKNYLTNSSGSNDENEFTIKLKQVETDWEVYKNIILSNTDIIEEEQKNSSVYKNYIFFHKELSKLKENGIEAIDLINHGLMWFNIISLQIELDKNEKPQEIFESMNSIGKPLSLADLVRNYLLIGLTDVEQERLYNQYWLPMEKLLPKRLSDFIRDYMQMTVEHSLNVASEKNYKELYSQFRNIFKDSESEPLLKDLLDYSYIYSAIVYGKSSNNDLIDRYLSDLRMLKVSTAYSFIMKLLNTWKNRELNDSGIIDILSAFKTYCMRRRLLMLTQAENKSFPEYVKFIPTLVEATDKKMTMFDFLSRQQNRLRLPNDHEIRRFLETFNFYNFQYSKFFLALVEEKLTRSRPDLTEKRLQLEHIMPRTLSEAWIESLGEDYEETHQKYVDTIGNLTLIRYNQELGNKSFPVKKEVYQNNSGLQIAHNFIVDVDIWNESSIVRREKWIVDYLLNTVMPVPDKMRERNNYVSGNGSGLSFLELGLIGEEINFVEDLSISAKVTGDKTVEFEGKKDWRLSPLTAMLKERRGTSIPSTAYQGARYWMYQGMKLSDLF